MPKLLCFGDSITYGAWDTEGGWVARIRKRIDKQCLESKLEKFYLTYNLGISSDSSKRLLERFDSEVSAHMREEGELQLIFSIGTNDSVRRVKDNQLQVGLDAFRKNIQELIQKAKLHSQKIAFLGSLPVDETKTQPYILYPDISSSNEDLEMYERVISEVCQEENVDFIPVLSEAKDYEKLLIFDGVHPNDAGHTFLADRVWKHLTSQKWL